MRSEADLPRQRHVLFLQGPPTSFWRELAKAFEEAGHRTRKIHLSPADALWWRRGGGTHFRGRFSRWKAFLREIVLQDGVTDIIFYADRQPYHVVAQQVAREAGINAIVIENGYLRPDWITLEIGGMGVYSHFPNDPVLIRALARGCPAADFSVQYRTGFWAEMQSEILYHCINYFMRPFYPFYRSGKYYNTLLEYVAGIPHILIAQRRAREAEAIIAKLHASKAPFHVVALQLQGDYQIRDNSPFRHISEMIELVASSFAAHAPSAMQLLFKLHPHDNGWEAWGRVVARAAARHGLGERIRLIDGGDLGGLLAMAQGCVLINSTVGLFCLRTGCPTKALGGAIYDIAGLTHQGSLDTFWTMPEPVDRALADDFVRLLAASIQIKGSFHEPQGRRVAINEIVRRVSGVLVNGPDALVMPPPRLVAARRMGVPIDHSN